MIKVCLAVVGSVVLTIAIFFMFYAMAWVIIKGGLYTCERIKKSYKEYRDRELD